MLTVGIKGKEEIVVTDANSAKTMGSGTLDVFATPAMIALMEKTAWKSVAPYLEEGCGTVGTLLNVTHDAPTPLGMKVWCESELTEIDGRRLVFSPWPPSTKQERSAGAATNALSYPMKNSRPRPIKRPRNRNGSGALRSPGSLPLK